MTKRPLSSAAALVALQLAASPAYAGTAERAFVSGHGTDTAGCGAPTTPCRSFEFVVSNVIAPGGEIDVLDPAGYGAVTIPFALSIVNDGIGAAGVQATSGVAITVNAGSGDAVTLRGLGVDGLGSASDGIVFNSGASLTVINCVVQHFANSGLDDTTGFGILMQPTSGAMSFLLTNVIAAANGAAGIAFRDGTSNASGVMDHVVVSKNLANGVLLGGGGATADIVIANSVVTNNTGQGIVAFSFGAPISVSAENVTVTGNTAEGIAASGAASVLLGRSTITSNGFAFFNSTSPNTLFTWGDNHITGGGDGATPTLNPTLHPQ